MAIQQHPVPQDISNYKFRLIGDMTIKQFASLGISIILSVVIYSVPLPFFFKYPLSFTFLLLGVGMAFVPVQGRTLDVWIVAFIKSIYSPTQYIWKHGQEDSPSNILNTNSSTTQNLQSTNSTPNTPVVEINPPTADQTVEPPKPSTVTNHVLDTQTNVPLVKGGNEGDLNTQTPTNINPIADTQTNVSLVKGGNEEDLKPQIAIESQTNPSTGLVSQAPTSTSEQPEPKLEPQPISQPTTTLTINDLPSTTPPTSSLPIPSTPSTPNTLVGLTLTPDGKTLDGVMVEIKNQNLTLRATKSNKLGQFLFVRPLENGLYQILAEKDDYKFETYSIELNGEIMNPLKIQALK